MSRFNITEIKLTDPADISKIMANFNSIDELGITYDEATDAINSAKTTIENNVNTKLNEYTKTTNLGNLALKNYSFGTAAPSGGSNGDIYDQYF